MLDPLGYTTMHRLWLSLNPLQKNTHIVTLEGVLLTNRMLWLGVAIVVLALAHLRFRFAYDGGGRGVRRAMQSTTFRQSAGAASPCRARGARSARRHACASCGPVTARSFRELVVSRGWLIVPLTVVVFIATAPVQHARLRPYPHRQVRVVEYPSSARGLRLTAHPGLIMYSEGFALVRPEDDPRRIDFPFAIMAHEWATSGGDISSIPRRWKGRPC